MKKLLTLIATFALLLPSTSFAAMQFNGTTQYVNIPASAGSSLDTTGSYTAIAWFKTTKADSMILQRFNLNGFSNGEAQMWVNTDATPHIRYNAAKDAVNNGFTGTHSAADGKWHMVAMIFNGSNQYAYFDGQPDGGPESATAITSNSEKWHIGTDSDAASDGSPGNYFGGTIDDVRIYNRALSAAEVRALYLGRGTHNGLVGWWPLWGNGNVAVDMSGKRHNGTYVGFTSMVRALAFPSKAFPW